MMINGTDRLQNVLYKWRLFVELNVRAPRSSTAVVESSPTKINLLTTA